MNRGRNTLILLVLAAALGAYVYFVESKRTATPDTGAPAPETRSKVFDKLDATMPAALRLERQLLQAKL